MRKIYKCRWNKKIFGVFGGLGQAIGIDPNILRIIAVFLIMPLGFVIVPSIYMLLALVLKDGPYCFVQPSYKRLYKNSRNKVIFGVISGLSDYSKIDVTILRITITFACIFTGFFPIVITYMAANYLIPEKPQQ